MTVSKGTKIIAVVIAAILFILLLVLIILLAIPGHDDKTGMYVVKEEFVQPLKITFKLKISYHRKSLKQALKEQN